MTADLPLQLLKSGQGHLRSSLPTEGAKAEGRSRPVKKVRSRRGSGISATPRPRARAALRGEGTDQREMSNPAASIVRMRSPAQRGSIESAPPRHCQGSEVAFSSSHTCAPGRPARSRRTNRDRLSGSQAFWMSSEGDPPTPSPHTARGHVGVGFDQAACSSWPASRSISSRLSVLGIDRGGRSRPRSRRTWFRSDGPPRRGGCLDRLDQALPERVA
jgi:hypothetical protein